MTLKNDLESCPKLSLKLRTWTSYNKYPNFLLTPSKVKKTKTFAFFRQRLTSASLVSLWIGESEAVEAGEDNLFGGQVDGHSALTRKASSATSLDVAHKSMSVHLFPLLCSSAHFIGKTVQRVFCKPDVTLRLNYLRKTSYKSVLY